MRTKFRDQLNSRIASSMAYSVWSTVHYIGVLACLDGYLNMALEQSEEYGVDGLLKAKYGDCFIRGNNGKFPC